MKYFICKNDHVVGEYEKKGKKERVLISAGQPFEIARDLSECGYVQLIGGLSAPTDLGSIADSISPAEELGMWKILAKYNEYLHFSYVDHLRSRRADLAKTVDRMSAELRGKDELIKALIQELKMDKSLWK